MKVKKNTFKQKRTKTKSPDKFNNKPSRVDSKKNSSSKVTKKKQRDDDRQAQRIRKLQLLEANEDENKEIKKLEKVLKLNKRRKSKDPKKSQKLKMSSAFVDDGLNYLLEVLDKNPEDMGSDISDMEQPGNEDVIETIFNKRKLVVKNEAASKRPQVGARKPRKLVDLLEPKYQKSQTLSNEELIDSAQESDNDDSQSEASDDNRDDVNSYDEDNNVKEQIKNKKTETWEDIYGRTRDKDGNVVKSNVPTYVPPAKRIKPDTVNEQKKAELSRIKRQLKGFLNRLSEANLKPISTQIEDMYMKYSRNDMNETLLSLLQELVLGFEQIPPRLMLDQAMLIGLLHANVGSEVGAFFLQSSAVKLNELMNLNENYGSGKQCNNLLTFLSHLYNFQVTDCTVMFDILKRLIESFRDKDIELIQLLLKSIGFCLRKDNPLKLKQMILVIQTKAPTFQSKDGSRVQFMLDTLTAIRNNNMYKIPDYDPSIIDHTKKLLRGFVRPGSSIQKLTISFEDLLHAEERGRWWIVGSAWSERENPDSSISLNANAVLPKSEVSEKILELARKQRMNTEVRRTIFCIIMTAEDYMDAFEKLLKLNLKHQQEREIINVLLHCVSSEKSFNPYYAYLTGKFCKYARKYHMNLQFALWDKFKELQNLKPRQIDSLASFLIHLFCKGDMPISILKVIQFSEMNKLMLQFFRKILLGVLLHDSEEVCNNVFQRIAPAKNLALLKEGLRLFMHHFLKADQCKLDSDTALKLSQRIKGAEMILNSEKHAFKL